MRRWIYATCAALVAALALLRYHVTSPSLLADTDTRVLLDTIRHKNAPFSWFWSDWPLYNHFYRPVATLTFEADSRLYHENAAGYGWTNAILASLSVVALFWLLRELLDKPLEAAAGAILFALWQMPVPPPLGDAVWYLALITLALGAVRHKWNWKAYVPAFLVMCVLIRELNGLESLYFRVLGWLPGRTASTMAIFALSSMAAYSRFERLRGRKGPEPSPPPLSPPATRNSNAFSRASATNWWWAVLAVVAGAMALATYEQAVMLPACLLGLAVTFRLCGFRPIWWLQVPFWLLLVAYLEIRHQVIPPGVSKYQSQQILTSRTAFFSLDRFVFPPISDYTLVPTWLEMGSALLFYAPLWQSLFGWISWTTTVWQLRRKWVLALSGCLLSLISFLPMAWLHSFEHYYYWPMAMRTILVIALASVAWELGSIAWSPPALQAPPRPSPAPGSLPRP